MRKKVFDTVILIRQWRRRARGAIGNWTAADAEAWARELIETQGNDAIVTPVYLEFVCGVTNRHEMELARAFLGQFRIIDEGKITPEDLAEARRLAERIPPGATPSPRKLGDCLIKAIASRRRHDVFTDDKDMPR